MKKVLNITIGHTVFCVEDDAFSMLDGYLSSIKTRLSKDADLEDIIDDIEIGIAEKFVLRGRSERSAITVADVETVIKEMGSAEDIDASSAKDADVRRSFDGTRQRIGARRLYRDPDDVVIAGVASGLAAYFGIDSLIVRVLFVAFLFAGSAGFWVYVILWLLVPVARTSSQKLEMRGERVTITAIRDQVEETIENLKKKDQTGLKKVAAFPFEIVRIFIRALRAVFAAIAPLVRITVGMFLVLIGSLAIAGVTIALIGVMPNAALLPLDPSAAAIIDDLFSTPVLATIAISAAFASVMIPFVVFLGVGLSMLRRKNMFTFRGVALLFIFWVVAVSLFVSAIVREAFLFM